MFAGIPPVSSPDKPTPAETSSAGETFASAMHGAVGAKSAYGANNAESVPLRSVLLPMLSDDSMRKVMEAAGGREMTLSPMEQYALDVVRNLRENGIFVTNAGDAVLTPDPETARILGGLIANYPFDRPRQDRPFPDVYPPDHFAANLERYFGPDFVETVKTWVENDGQGNLPGEGSPFFRPTR
ncbi:MAG: hypothetical protein ACXIVD_16350 [Salinarimonas sp.]